MKKSIVILSSLLVLACVLGAQQQPPAKTQGEFKIPPEAAAKANPVKPSPESMNKAKKTYAIDCAMCHGENGNGKGELAADMKNVTDFTAPDAMKNQTDGELFYIIRKGKAEMPPEGDRAKDDDVWGLVNYIRAFAKK